MIRDEGVGRIGGILKVRVTVFLVGGVPGVFSGGWDADFFQKK